MRQCPFAGCGKTHSPELFCCPAHWRQLPQHLRDEVYAAYRGWEAGRVGAAELRARQAAVVAEFEGGGPAVAVADPPAADLPPVQQCRTCGAAVRWVENATTGTRSPLDADPVQYGGNCVIEGGKYRVLKKGEPTAYGTPRYRSHFVTCTQAAKWRKKK